MIEWLVCCTWSRAQQQTGKCGMGLGWRGQIHEQSCAYLMNVRLEPATCTYGRMTRIFYVPVWQDRALMVRACILWLKQIQDVGKMSISQVARYWIHFFFQEDFKLVKVYHEQTDRRTDGGPARSSGSVNKLTFPSLVTQKKKKKKNPPGSKFSQGFILSSNTVKFQVISYVG